MASTFLCDTNIVSELGRRSPNAGVLSWATTVTQIYVSSITLEEISFGLAAKPNSRIQAWFAGFLEEFCIILPVTEQIGRLSGQMRGHLRQMGQQRTQADMLIAATAQVHQLALVTRNVRDFEGCNIALINPFDLSEPY